MHCCSDDKTQYCERPLWLKCVKLPQVSSINVALHSYLASVSKWCWHSLADETITQMAARTFCVILLAFFGSHIGNVSGCMVSDALDLQLHSLQLVEVACTCTQYRSIFVSQQKLQSTWYFLQSRYVCKLRCLHVGTETNEHRVPGLHLLTSRASGRQLHKVEFTV